MSEEVLEARIEVLEERVEHLQEQLDIVIEQRDDIHIDKQVLQKQLNEANDTLIKSQNMKQPDRNNFVAQYLLKWGVK